MHRSSLSILEPSSDGLRFPSGWVWHCGWKCATRSTLGFELRSELLVESDLWNSKVEVESGVVGHFHVKRKN